VTEKTSSLQYYAILCSVNSNLQQTIPTISTPRVAVGTGSGRRRPYLDDAVEARDGVDLGRLGDKLALDLVAHRLDGVGVRPDEGHALRCLATPTRRSPSITQNFISRVLFFFTAIPTEETRNVQWEEVYYLLEKCSAQISIKYLHLQENVKCTENTMFL